MIYVKGVLIGVGTVLVGCLVAPIVLMVWAGLNSHGETTVSFSLMGLANHLSHSLGFWAFNIVLFTVGFVPSVFLAKR